jgi:predicted Rossmann fold flavoprotein
VQSRLAGGIALRGVIRYPADMGRQETFDVVVVGGGPAGLTAAFHAARRGSRAALIDRKAVPGEKIAIAGGGRCNVLPTSVDPGVYVTDSSKHTLRKILLSWPLDEVRTFLEQDIGLRLREEASTGKLFPTGGDGKEVRRRLLLAVDRVGVRLETKALVSRIEPGKPHRLQLESGREVLAGRVVVATGGLSYPRTGSDGIGLEIARELGHTIVEPYPALVALRGGPASHRDLTGVSAHVIITVDADGKRIRSEGGLLFTHRGYSGPAVLNIGHLAARASRDGRPLRILVSWSGRTVEDWMERLGSGDRSVRDVVREVLPDRLVVCLLAELGLAHAKLAMLRKRDRQRLVEALTAYPLPWRRSGGFDEAEVTGGGVRLSEVDPRTLCSRIVPGVHFCGEILDAFGPIGGTNFLWAFVTGKCAGEGAAGG